MKFCYADPPYYGLAVKFYGAIHPEAAVYDTIEGHAALIERLGSEYPDGWAMSMTSGNLRDILPLCPPDVRVAAWVKPFCSFKPGVPVAYAWEPVVFRGGRKRGKQEPTTRDWIAENITLMRGFQGAKPARFTRWILDLLGAERGDTIDDLFPGSGSVGRAIQAWRESFSGHLQEGMFD